MTQRADQGTVEVPSSVITQPGGKPDGQADAPGCLFCGAPLRRPAKANRPVKFCKGNRCRSGWHAAKKRDIIGRIKEQFVAIERLLEELL